MKSFIPMPRRNSCGATCPCTRLPIAATFSTRAACKSTWMVRLGLTTPGTPARFAWIVLAVLTAKAARALTFKEENMARSLRLVHAPAFTCPQHPCACPSSACGIATTSLTPKMFLTSSILPAATASARAMLALLSTFPHGNGRRRSLATATISGGSARSPSASRSTLADPKSTQTL